MRTQQIVIWCVVVLYLILAGLQIAILNPGHPDWAMVSPWLREPWSQVVVAGVMVAYAGILIVVNRLAIARPVRGRFLLLFLLLAPPAGVWLGFYVRDSVFELLTDWIWSRGEDTFRVWFPAHALAALAMALLALHALVKRTRRSATPQRSETAR